MAMLLNKTDKARAALHDSRDAGLSLHERRVLILTDGKRTLNDVMAMLGPDILPAIDRLLRDGYIGDANAAITAPSMARASTLGGAVTGLLRAATDAVQAHTAQLRAPAPAAPATSPAGVRTEPEAVAPLHGGTRRSLVAAKMYRLDMLQLQRDPEAVELRAQMQCAVDDEALVAVLARALRALQRLSPPSYSQRVAARMAELLPEDALAQLEALRNDPGPPALSIVA
jgi:hypothetical protein